MKCAFIMQQDNNKQKHTAKSKEKYCEDLLFIEGSIFQ